MKQEADDRVCTWVTLRIRDECEPQAVVAALTTLQAMTRQEPGCLRFDLFRSDDHPRQLMLLEAFASQAAFERHLQATYTQDYFALGMTEVVASLPLSALKNHGAA